ncbi:MAG: terminase family protein, partial [Patescibacteria group bacterium]|nr:terminase family protein [Patescibacteria group bacterium]
MSQIEEVSIAQLCNFFPKQKMAWEALKLYKYLLFGGAMGGGKSAFLRRAGMAWLTYLTLKYELKGLRGGIFCEDYPALDDRQVSKIRPGGDDSDLFPAWLGEWKEGDHEFVAHPEYGSWVLSFRNLDKPSKYDSTEFAFIGVDEIHKNPYNTFKVLRRRLRWSLPNRLLTDQLASELRFAATANPGGESWVKDTWIDRIFPIEEREADQFYFIPSLPTDNPHLSTKYLLQLQSMSPEEQAAYMQGRWDAFEQVMDIHGYLRLLTDPEINNAFIDINAHSGNVVLGVDVGEGGDESVIVKKTDTCQEVIFNQKLKDPMVLVALVVKAIIAHRATAVCIDKTGVGSGPYYRLDELKRQRKWLVDIAGITFGAKALKTELYADRKAELYWAERTWILHGGKWLRNGAWSESKTIKYKKDSDDKIVIQPKPELRKAGIRSPNVF